MSIPHDERQHYDAAIQDMRENEPSMRPQFSEEQLRGLKLVSHQAAQVVRQYPELLAYLADIGRAGVPDGRADAAHVALWREGFRGAVDRIYMAADWPDPEDEDNG